MVNSRKRSATIPKTVILRRIPSVYRFVESCHCSSHSFYRATPVSLIHVFEVRVKGWRLTPFRIYSLDAHSGRPFGRHDSTSVNYGPARREQAARQSHTTPKPRYVSRITIFTTLVYTICQTITPRRVHEIAPHWKGHPSGGFKASGEANTHKSHDIISWRR